jgi:beta-lactamase class A
MGQRSRVSLFVARALIILSFAALPVPGRGQPSLAGLQRLEKQIRDVIEGEEGEVGVSLLHIETGRALAVNGDTPFPMASTFKVPILVEVLAQVREGRFTLDDEVRVQKTDQHLGSGMLSSLTAPGIVLSVRNLINLMMLVSDNSATDMLLAKVGVEKVNARLKALGIGGISVDRPCQKLIMDFLGMDYAKYGHLPLDEITATRRGGGRWTPEDQKKAVQAFSADLQDQATPKAMTALLAKIFRKEIIDPASCEIILDIMLKCQTGEGRIKGGLPPGTAVAHKTGTIAGTVDDCGIIYLPDGQGHLVLTVWTKNFMDDTEDVEAIIARIARFAYDYFYFTDGAAAR